MNRARSQGGWLVQFVDWAEQSVSFAAQALEGALGWRVVHLP